jgi:hypothetical protein
MRTALQSVCETIWLQSIRPHLESSLAVRPLDKRTHPDDYAEQQRSGLSHLKQSSRARATGPLPRRQRQICRPDSALPEDQPSTIAPAPSLFSQGRSLRTARQNHSRFSRSGSFAMLAAMRRASSPLVAPRWSDRFRHPAVTMLQQLVQMPPLRSRREVEEASMRTAVVVVVCSAVAGFWAPLALAQQKTVQACRAEWQANKAIFQPKCPFQNFLSLLNHLDSRKGGLIRGGAANVDA